MNERTFCRKVSLFGIWYSWVWLSPCMVVIGVSFQTICKNIWMGNLNVILEKLGLEDKASSLSEYLWK